MVLVIFKLTFHMFNSLYKSFINTESKIRFDEKQYYYLIYLFILPLIIIFYFNLKLQLLQFVKINQSKMLFTSLYQKISFNHKFCKYCHRFLPKSCGLNPDKFLACGFAPSFINIFAISLCVVW